MAKRMGVPPPKVKCIFCQEEFERHVVLWQISPDATYWAAMCWDCVEDIAKSVNRNKKNGRKRGAARAQNAL